MDFGINLATSADSWKIVKRAEELGFARAWFYDTPLLCAEPFVAMGAAAMQTSKIRLATGVMIPSNRLAPTAASGLMALNALAPGRIDFGISTGFTARRTMGMGALKLGDMKRYIEVVQGIIEGKTPDWEFEGEMRKVRFMSPDIGVVNMKDPIPLHVSAFGPKARALTAALNAHWIMGVGNSAMAKVAIGAMHKAWQDAGVDISSRIATAFAGGSVLREGEAFDSPRVKAEAGPGATIALHDLAEAEEFGSHFGKAAPPPFLAPSLERYRKIYAAYPEATRHMENHRGHLMFLRPEEQELCTAEMIQAMTFTDTKPRLQERIRELSAAGYNHFAFHIRHGHPSMLEEWADVIAGV